MSNFIPITAAEWELIERHLNGALSAEEKKEFESKASIDAGWHEKVKQVQLTMLGVGEAALQRRLDSFHQAIGKKTTLTVVKSQGWKKWLVAASVISCLLVAGFLFTKQPAGDQLFNAYYKEDPGLPVVMGASEENYTLYDGMISYKEADYSSAIKKFELAGRQSGFTDTLNYYIGLSYMAAKIYPSARQHLYKVEALKNSGYRQKAKWYLALIYIRNKDVTTAKKILQDLSEYPGAAELLRKLNEED